MPIPKPKSGETQTEFVSKCINDSVMKAEYNPAQRIAICYDAWNLKRK